MATGRKQCHICSGCERLSVYEDILHIRHIKGDNCSAVNDSVVQCEWLIQPSVIMNKGEAPLYDRGEWAGYPLGVCGWTAGQEAASAYLIRSRPSGKKINSLGLLLLQSQRKSCYQSTTQYLHCWTDTHPHGHTHTPPAHIPAHIQGRTNTGTCVHIHRGEAGARVKVVFEKHDFSCTNNRDCSFFSLCVYVAYVQLSIHVQAYIQFNKEYLNILLKQKYE